MDVATAMMNMVLTDRSASGVSPYSKRFVFFAMRWNVSLNSASTLFSGCSTAVP